MHSDRVAALARDRGAAPVEIWHSGKLRARQTAEAFWRACNPLAGFTAIRGLQPTDPPEWIRDLVTGETRDVMLVGHMPSLPKILRLLTNDPSADFTLHGLIGLRFDGAKWVEEYRLP